MSSERKKVCTYPPVVLLPRHALFADGLDGPGFVLVLQPVSISLGTLSVSELPYSVFKLSASTHHDLIKL